MIHKNSDLPRITDLQLYILGLSRDLVFGRTKLATLMKVVSLLMHEIFGMFFYLTVGWIEFLLEILEVFFSIK